MNESKFKVQAWICRKTEDQVWEFLLLKRSPKRGGFWQPVTGNLKDGKETTKECALREVGEETGYYINSSEMSESIFEFTWPHKGEDMHEQVFVTDITKIYEPEHEPEISKEHKGYQWCTEDEVRKVLIMENTQNCFTKVLEHISQK